MNLPEGYIALEFVGFTDKGEYSSGSVYMKNDLVHIDNSIWKCLEDNTTGIDPGNDDGKWEIFMRSASEASGILATDTEGIAGEKNEKVSTQILLDEITGRVNGLRNPEFEDYTGETQIPEPDDAVGMLTSGKPIDVIHQYTKASLWGILTITKKALNIALGKNQARVFASVEDLDVWLAVPSNTEKLNVGDNFYIVATDVPDYWWDGTQKQKLETQKVDLTTYNQRITANANAISDLNEKLGECLLKNGETQFFNSVSDLNYFYTGIGLFNTDTLNLPTSSDTWYIVISAGLEGTVAQRAYGLMYGDSFFRKCTAGNWLTWDNKNFATESYVDNKIQAITATANSDWIAWGELTGFSIMGKFFLSCPEFQFAKSESFGNGDNALLWTLSVNTGIYGRVFYVHTGSRMVRLRIDGNTIRGHYDTPPTGDVFTVNEFFG